MFVYNDGIISYEERKEESDYKVKSERNVVIIKDSEKVIENMVYINIS